MTPHERDSEINELKQQLSELRKVRTDHGSYKIDFQMLEIEDQIADLRHAAAE